MKTCLTPALILLLATAPLLHSAVPLRINYQGRVTDSNGAAIGSGTPVNRKVLFRIWNHATNTAAANRLWTEEQTITIFNGEFSVLLGQGSVFPGEANSTLDTIFADTSPDRFLEITVDNGDNTLNGTDQAITPRQQMTTVGFAMRARTAETVASGQDLIFSGGPNAGLGWYGTGRTFNATAVDGPVLYGNAGGALGALNGGIASTALRWNNSGNVGIGGPALGAGATKLVLQADDSSDPPQQLRINGSTNTNKRLLLGYNTTSNYGALQAYTNNTNTAPLLLNPAGGNIGIGTLTPAAMLDLAPAAGTLNGIRLGNTADSASRFIGIMGTTVTLGSNTGFSGVEFGGPGGPSDGAEGYLAFHTHDSGQSSAERMRIDKSGSVGIGTTAPTAGVRLDVNGTIKATTFSGSGASLTNLPAASLTGTIAEAQLPTTLVRLSTSNTFTGTNSFKGGLNAVMTQPTINTGTSGTQFLDFNGVERGYIGNAGADGAILAATTTGDFAMRATTGDAIIASADANGHVLLNPSSGKNVGIGTNVPTQAKLVVNGSVGFIPGVNHFYFRDNGQNNPAVVGVLASSSSLSASIWASNEIVANAYRALSDERIKTIHGVSDSSRDLHTLRQIEVTDYSHKDVVSYGTMRQKKIIAQQVEKVFPEVVSKAVAVVPDIFKKAVHQEGWVVLRTDLKVGERVRLLDDQNHEAIEEVLEVAEGKFRTAFKPAKDQIFVYGREVKDFRTVDYESISMLNVSATQEIARRLEAKSAEVAALEERVQELEARDRELAARDQARDAKLVAMEKLLRSLEQPAAKSVSVKKRAAAAQ